MFSRLFRNSLSSLLRKSADVSTLSTETLKFGDFVKSLPVPSSLHVFRMEPLRGYCLLVVESKLVFAFVDTFFGGTGSSKVKITGRDFSSIEIRMTKSVVTQGLEDMEKAWEAVHPVNINYVRSEVNPQFAAIVPPSDVVIVILFDIEFEAFSGNITVCLPYPTLEPIIPKLKAAFQSEEMEVDQDWLSQLQNQMLTAEIEIVAELGKTPLTTAELLKLKVGDTLMLGNDISDPLTLKVQDIPKFKGFPGVSRGCKAIQITEVLKNEGRKHGRGND